MQQTSQPGKSWRVLLPARRHAAVNLTCVENPSAELSRAVGRFGCFFGCYGQAEWLESLNTYFYLAGSPKR